MGVRGSGPGYSKRLVSRGWGSIGDVDDFAGFEAVGGAKALAFAGELVVGEADSCDVGFAGVNLRPIGLGFVWGGGFGGGGLQGASLDEGQEEGDGKDHPDVEEVNQPGGWVFVREFPFPVFAVFHREGGEEKGAER